MITYLQVLMSIPGTFGKRENKLVPALEIIDRAEESTIPHEKFLFLTRIFELVFTAALTRVWFVHLVLYFRHHVLTYGPIGTQPRKLQVSEHTVPGE